MSHATQSQAFVDGGSVSDDNGAMEISGHIHNGAVILDQSTSLPEGTPVTLRSGPLVQFAKNRKRVEFPLVQSNSPGSVDLTNQRIAEILDDEDTEAMKRTWHAP